MASTISGFLTPEQAADIIGTTPAAVRVWLRNGELQGVRIGDDPGEQDDRRPWLIPEKAVKQKAKQPRDPRGRPRKDS